MENSVLLVITTTNTDHKGRLSHDVEVAVPYSTNFGNFPDTTSDAKKWLRDNMNNSVNKFLIDYYTSQEMLEFDKDTRKQRNIFKKKYSSLSFNDLIKMWDGPENEYITRYSTLSENQVILQILDVDGSSFLCCWNCVSQEKTRIVKNKLEKRFSKSKIRSN